MNNIDIYKKDFPFFLNNPNTIFLDSAASSLTPDSVIKEVNSYYQKYSVNIHRGLYKQSYEATLIYEESKKEVKKFINAKSSQEIIYTRNATEGFNLLAYTLPYFKTDITDLFAWKNGLQKQDIILLSEMEHHANIVPWHILATRFNLKIVYIPIDKKSHRLDLSFLKTLNFSSTQLKIVSISQMSNVLGVINDIEVLRLFAKKHGSLFIVDGAQSVCHIPIDVQKIKADFFLFSAHKMLGPTGIGVLWGRQDILKELPEFQGGGDMILSVKKEKIIFNSIPQKYEAGTPHIAGAFGLQKAIQYLNYVGIKNIQEYELFLFQYALELLKKENIVIYASEITKDRGGIISFYIPNIHPHDVGSFFAEKNIAIRVGHHCCQILMEALNVSSTCRASFYFYNTEKDIQAFVKAIREVISFFG